MSRVFALFGACLAGVMLPAGLQCQATGLSLDDVLGTLEGRWNVSMYSPSNPELMNGLSTVRPLDDRRLEWVSELNGVVTRTEFIRLESGVVEHRILHEGTTCISRGRFADGELQFEASTLPLCGGVFIAWTLRVVSPTQVRLTAAGERWGADWTRFR